MGQAFKKKAIERLSVFKAATVKGFIVDFFSKDLKLIIEVDGEIHKFQKKKDKQREEEIKKLGFSVIRFQNEDILYELINVQRILESFIDEFEKTDGKREVRQRRNVTP